MEIQPKIFFPEGEENKNITNNDWSDFEVSENVLLDFIVDLI